MLQSLSIEMAPFQAINFPPVKFFTLIPPFYFSPNCSLLSLFQSFIASNKHRIKFSEILIFKGTVNPFSSSKDN